MIYSLGKVLYVAVDIHFHLFYDYVSLIDFNYVDVAGIFWRMHSLLIFFCCTATLSEISREFMFSFIHCDLIYEIHVDSLMNN